MFKVLGTMWFPMNTRNPFYTPLKADSDEEAKQHVDVKYEDKKPKWNILSIFTACFASGVLGFALARVLNKNSIVLTSSGPQFAKEPYIFSYNRSFSYPPSNVTDNAWDELFPGKGNGGFFNHPYLKGERATLSVLHQLHCLDGIRRIYYLNNDAATSGTLLVEEELEPHMRRSHMRHCIDFLRQSLMCCGDSSIEIVDPELKGVTGWDTEHMCTNWEELQDWVRQGQKLEREGESWR
ncbi:84749db0-a147-457c-8d33-f5aafdea4d70 [Sclerotinia trifoliorum]|uniref:84749db0-a147-457c-8d33-f5aafdea4d70 n=1 Tax=Sclerotinia trifoliorum TaxID=28548 RepID=A0A8H2W4P0_9HELO|nr:84749db0-a147-457c-8d33-f5aafdea4d70 [Sclerotinia trifoliorum]